MKKLILIGCLFIFSCGVLKKEKSTTTVQTEKTETKKDSTTNVKVNKAINDKVTTNVQPSGDPVLDAKIDAILSNLNTTKSSGDNSYRFYYDAKLRELKAEFAVAKTQDSVATTNSKTEKSFEESVDEYVKKIVVPWWMYLIGIILIFPYIKGVLFFFMPQLRGLKTMRDVITPPNKD